MAQNAYPSASRLADLVERLYAGQPVSRLIIREVQACGASAARNRMDWLEERFGERLVDVRDERGRAARALKCLPQHSTGAVTGNGGLLELIAAHVAGTALESLRGSRLHAALGDGQRTRLGALDGQDFDRFSRAVQCYERYHPIDVPDARRGVVDAIFDAIMERRVVEFSYRPLGRPAQRYRVEPYLIVDYRGTLYLYGRKVDVEGRDATDHRRNFGLDGIEHIRPDPDRRAVPAPDARRLLRADLADAFGFFRVRSAPVEVRLKAKGGLAIRLERSPLHRSQTIVRRGPDGIELTLRVRLCPEFISTLMAALPDVEVIAPRELVAQLSRRLKDAMEHLESHASDSDTRESDSDTGASSSDIG